MDRRLAQDLDRWLTTPPDEDGAAVCERCAQEVDSDEVMFCEQCARDGLCPDCYHDHGCDHAPID